MTVTKETDPGAPLKHLCREVERRGSRPATAGTVDLASAIHASSALLQGKDLSDGYFDGRHMRLGRVSLSDREAAIADAVAASRRLSLRTN